MGRAVIAALGIGTSATHMEWFAGPKGLYFSEIGCRPPGVRCWDLYAAGNDIDIYREWASAVVHGQVSRPAVTALRRRHHRPAPRPRRGDHRLRRARRDPAAATASGSSTPTCRGAGTPTQPVEAGYMANAWVRLRHPDYDTLRGMLDDVGRTVQVHAA